MAECEGRDRLSIMQLNCKLVTKFPGFRKPVTFLKQRYLWHANIQMLELSKRDYKNNYNKSGKINHMCEEMRNFSGEMKTEKN